MRRFELHRDEDVSGVSGTGVVAEGVAFSDDTVALRWASEWPTSVVFHDRGTESLEAVHGHSGRTRIVWLDPEQEGSRDRWDPELFPWATAVAERVTEWRKDHMRLDPEAVMINHDAADLMEALDLPPTLWGYQVEYLNREFPGQYDVPTERVDCIDLALDATEAARLRLEHP